MNYSNCGTMYNLSKDAIKLCIDWLHRCNYQPTLRSLKIAMNHAGFSEAETASAIRQLATEGAIKLITVADAGGFSVRVELVEG